MNTLWLVIAIIAVLFVLLLIIKTALPQKIKDKLCAVCLAVSLTWLTLLILYFNGQWQNASLLALLMGQSVVGVFYWLQAKKTAGRRLAQLPILLTLTWLAYLPFGEFADIWRTAILIAAVWLVICALYVYRHNRRLAGLVDKLIKCCKQW